GAGSRDDLPISVVAQDCCLVERVVIRKDLVIAVEDVAHDLPRGAPKELQFANNIDVVGSVEILVCSQLTCSVGFRVGGRFVGDVSQRVASVTGKPRLAVGKPEGA